MIVLRRSLPEPDNVLLRWTMGRGTAPRRDTTSACVSVIGKWAEAGRAAPWSQSLHCSFPRPPGTAEGEGHEKQAPEYLESQRKVVVESPAERAEDQSVTPYLLGVTLLSTVSSMSYKVINAKTATQG